ncbi:TPA: hypothetical protein ACH3X2_005514 [Trebouxia sp. C0005]
MVGLTVTSFKTKTSDHFNQVGAIKAGRPLIPHIISPQRLLYLFPNVQLLDLREGIQTEQLLPSNMLAGLTALTKLSLKCEPSQLQPALATLHRLSADLNLEIVSRPAPGRSLFQLTAADLPTKLVELKLSNASICLQSMHLADTLDMLTGLQLSRSSLGCACCRSCVPLLASCSNLAALSLNDAASPAFTEEVFRFSQLSSLTQLTSLAYRGSHPTALSMMRAVGSTLSKLSLHLEDAAVITGSLSRVLDAISNMEKLTFLRLDVLMGSWDLPVLSLLPHLETLDIKVAINDDDAMSGASGRLRALCFSGDLKTIAVDFTGTSKTCVSLFTCQLFAHALQLQSASFSSENVTRFVMPSQQPNYNVTVLKLLNCVCLDDKGLIDTTLCFPALTDLAVGSACISAAGLGRITKLTRLQNLDLEGCSFIKAAAVKDVVANMHHLGVLRLAPHVAKDLCKHKKRFRKDLLLDDRVCRQM